MALINLQTNKPKLNVSNIRSPFGGGGSIPKISAGAGSFIRRPSTGIKPAKFFDVGRLSQIKTNVNVADDLSRQNSNVNAIAGQLAEINAVMQDIGGALALDFANRITEQKQDNKDLKDQVKLNRRALAEKSVEGVKKIGKSIGSGITGLASKTGSVLGLGKILEAGKFLAAGIAINALWPQIEKIFDWSMKNLDKILLVAGGLLALNVIGGLGTLLKFGAFFLNPKVLAIMAIISSGIIAKDLAGKLSNYYKNNPEKDFVGDPIPGSPKNANAGEWFRDQNGTIWVKQSFNSSNGGWSEFSKGLFGNKTPKGKELQMQKMHDGGIVTGSTQEVPAILERGEAVLTKEQLALISKKPGINFIEMNLPDIRVPSNKTAKNISLPETTQVPYASSVNLANKHMTKTPEIHGIIG